jgi:gluconate 2-dehydrogenase gamma chain
LKEKDEIDCDPSRREFIKGVRGSSLVLLIPKRLRDQLFRLHDEPSLASSLKENESYVKTLTATEAAILEALCSRIIPGDNLAGAKEANVVRFIDNMLAAQYAPNLKAYRTGLSLLDRHALHTYGRHFARLSVRRQDSVVTELAAGRISGWTGCAAFFSMVRVHTIEGMFSDPAYGGNANGVGWKLFASVSHDR